MRRKKERSKQGQTNKQAGVSNWRYGAKKSANDNVLAPSTVQLAPDYPYVYTIVHIRTHCVYIPNTTAALVAVYRTIIMTALGVTVSCFSSL